VTGNESPSGLPGRRSSLGRNAGFTVAALIITGLIRLLAKVGAAEVSVAALGMITAGFAVATIVTIVGAGGMSPGISKFISQLRGEKRNEDAGALAGVSARWATGFAVAGALAATGYAATNATLRDGGAAVVVGTGVLTLVFGVYLAGKAIAYGADDVKRYARFEIVGAFGFAIAMAAVIVVGEAELVLIPLVVAFAPVAWLALRWLRTPGRRGLPVREFRGYAVIGVIGSLAGLGFTYATPLAASYVDPLLGAALVGGALAVLEPLGFVPRTVGLVLLPDLSHRLAAGEQRDGSATALRLGTALSAAVAVPVCALLVLERDRILQLVFPDEIVGGMNLAWFSAAYLLSVIAAPSISSLAAIRFREASVAMWSSVAGFVLAIFVWVLAADEFGVVAIGFGFFVGSIVRVAAPLVISSRFYRIRWGSFWLRLAAAVAVIVFLATRPPSVAIDAAGLGVALIALWPEARELWRRAIAAQRRRGRSS
jgi:O-antigen/teichoic acid export membrane protein